MKKLNNIYRLLPLEIYLLLIPSLILFLITFLSNFKFILNDTNIFLQKINIINTLLFQSKFGYALLFLSLTLTFSLLKQLLKKHKINDNIKKKIINFCYIMFILCIVFLLLSLTTLIVYYTIPFEKTLKTTLLIKQIDKSIFNINLLSLPIVFKSTLIEKISLYSYLYLTFIYSISLILIAFHSKKLFKNMLRTFLLLFIISIPIWIILPVVSPDALYNTTIFNYQFFDLNNTSKIFQNFNKYFQSIWIDYSKSSFSVSSLPSLHAGWGLIIIWYIFKSNTNKIIKYLFLIWFIFELFGTFYSLQHFVIDIVVGLFFSFLSIFFVEWIQKKEIIYYQGSDLYNFIDILQKK